MIPWIYASGVVNALVALACLLGLPGRVTAVRVVVTAFLTAGLVLAELAAFAVFGLGRFGFLHVAWIQLGWVVPACGVCMLAARLRGREVTGRALTLAALGALAFACTIHAQYVGPRDLRLEHATVPLAPERAGSSPIRIGVLADIQAERFTDYERGAVRRLMEQEPDVILIPGDVFQGDIEDYDATEADLLALIRSLRAPYGVYMVAGNTDVEFALERMFEGSSVTVLDDEVARVSVRDRQLTLLGAERPRGLDRRLRDFETQPGTGDVRIVMMHFPRVAMHLSRASRVDLVVAGHTHGGQVVLPFFGPPIVLSPMPRDICAGGLHEYRGNLVYVSRGVGMERGNAPRIRFLCPPEITLLTLE